MRVLIQRFNLLITTQRKLSMCWLNGISGSMRSITSGDFTTGLGHSGQDGLEERSSVNGTSMQFMVSGSLSTRVGTSISDIKSDLNDLYKFHFLFKYR